MFIYKYNSILFSCTVVKKFICGEKFMVVILFVLRIMCWINFVVGILYICIVLVVLRMKIYLSFLLICTFVIFLVLFFWLCGLNVWICLFVMVLYMCMCLLVYLMMSNEFLCKWLYCMSYSTLIFKLIFNSLNFYTRIILLIFVVMMFLFV